MMTKLKRFLISIQNLDPYDEFEINAKNLKEAKKKAEKILNEEYEYPYEITDIEEVV